MCLPQEQKKRCLKGDACEFCHTRSHTRVRKTKYQRDRDCFRCWERGPCASIRGSCTSGAACECCHSHALAEGRSSEYQRATARHVGSSDRIAGAAALPLPRARGAHPTFLEPAQCRCAECGSPCRTAATLVSARYNSNSLRCHECTEFCSCLCSDAACAATTPIGDVYGDGGRRFERGSTPARASNGPSPAGA